jgi:predicted TIM-barrel fold metal-dependent hydrolase
MRLGASDTLNAFVCDDAKCHANHAGTSAACCGSRRTFLRGLAATAASVVLDLQQANSQPAPPTEKPFRIDVHHHLSSPGFIAEISGRRTGQVPLMKWTVAQSLDDMDKGGVATSILSISEPSVFFGNYDAARSLARETNEFGARLIADHPSRFGMFATVPLPDVDGALREIEYTLDTLKMDGICMMTDYQGKFLGDPAFKPVLEELNRRNAVVYTHPFRNDCCRNLVPDVFEPLIELGTDTTRTIASLLFSGAAERYPDIQWIFSHAGGTAPFLMQRFTYYFAARKDLQPRLPKGPAYYLERFYYDTANAMTIHPLASLTQLVKPTQIVFGTDFPFLTAKATAAGLRDVGLFSAADLQAIERGNAARMMPRYKG